ncbi:hypothetical protein K1719_027249 [Acacia pycnantha]|nr:hypothetical protein K1719_027249 [Acacia pycnantha]
MLLHSPKKTKERNWIAQPSNTYKRQQTDKVIEVAKPVVEALKGKGVSAIGAVGFCWGGVEIPIVILGVQHDTISHPELIRHFEQILFAKPAEKLAIMICPCNALIAYCQ